MTKSTGVGRGRRPSNTIAMFWEAASPCPLTGCWWWTQKFQNADGSGYGQFSLNGENRLVHRLAFFLSYGWWPAVVMHTCDQPACFNPTHLVAGTYKLNSQDAVNKGRIPAGDRHYARAMGADSDHAIRVLCASTDFPQRTIARWFGVSPTYVCVLLGKA